VSYLSAALAVAEHHDQVYVAMSEDPAGGWYDLYEDRESENPFDTVVEDVVLILADQDYDHEGVLADEGLTITLYDKTSGKQWEARDGADETQK
jgi:hypothetical protein